MTVSVVLFGDDLSAGSLVAPDPFPEQPADESSKIAAPVNHVFRPAIISTFNAIETYRVGAYSEIVRQTNSSNRLDCGQG